jgi:hypothetical protein
MGNIMVSSRLSTLEVEPRLIRSFGHIGMKMSRDTAFTKGFRGFWRYYINHPPIRSPPGHLVIAQETGEGFRVSTREVADMMGVNEHDSVYARLFRHVQVSQLEA